MKPAAIALWVAIGVTATVLLGGFWSVVHDATHRAQARRLAPETTQRVAIAPAAVVVQSAAVTLASQRTRARR